MITLTLILALAAVLYAAHRWRELSLDNAQLRAQVASLKRQLRQR